MNIELPEIAKCPCGKTPNSLGIMADTSRPKWAFVYPDCCEEWHIEFRANYNHIDSFECKHLAFTAWNNAPREKA